MRATLMLVLALLAPASVAADALLEAIGRNFESHAVVRAQFEQHKSIAALKRPLVTTGRLVFSREQGVLWHIDRPYAAVYVMGGDSVVEIGADGMRRKRSIAEMPGLSHVNRVFQALLRADTEILAEYFTVTARGDVGGGWELDLVPRQAQLAQALKRIRVEGGQFIEGIHVEEANGDAMRIAFRGIGSATSLGDDERVLLEGR